MPHNIFLDMNLALVLPLILLLLPTAHCQANQFTFPMPRKVGDVAISFQVGNTYNIEWATTATSYFVSVASEDRGPYSQTFGINNPDGSQVTSPRSFRVGSNLNASLGGFFFLLSLPGGDDTILFESDNFYPVSNGAASPAQLSSARVSVATVSIVGGRSSAATTSTSSTTSSTATSTVPTPLTTAVSSLVTTTTSSPPASATTAPAAGTNALAIGLGVGLGVPLALAIVAATYFLIQHQRRARQSGEKGGISDGAWAKANNGPGTDAERHNELSREEEYRELDGEGNRRAELESNTRAVEAGGRPIMEMQ